LGVWLEKIARETPVTQDREAPPAGEWQQSKRKRHAEAVIISIANQKGGVGKSTTAVNLGASLGELGHKTLVVDLDPQGNTTTGLGLDRNRRERCIYDALVSDMPVSELIESTEIEHLFAVPATIQLAGAEIELVPAFSREQKLKSALEPITESFDFVIVDCPPSLGLLTVNALTAADQLLIPIQAEYYAMEGLSKLQESVRLVRTHLNPKLEIIGVLMTMYDGRTKLAQEVVEEVTRHFQDKVFKTLIPRTVRLSEAPSHGKPIITYDSSSRGADAYRRLAKEVVRRV
jgi:chromosome partitioning protein